MSAITDDVAPLPAGAEYEATLRALSSEELGAMIEALSTVSRCTDENERLSLAIVRELSTREAYLRASERRHPAGGGN